MTVGQLTNLLAAITVFEMMLTIGMGVTLADVLAVARSWRTLWLTAVANYLAVPAIAVALLLLFDPHPMVAAGFLVVAVCPGAPYGPPLVAAAKGNVILAIGLMVLLAGSSAIFAPLLLKGLLPFVAGDTPVRVDALKILSTLLLIQLLPMCIGLYLRQRHAALAAKAVRPLTLISKILNVALIAMVLSLQYSMLANIRLAGYGGMLALVTASAAVGWLAGTDPESRKTLSITTSVRNAGVALVIATASFGGTPAVAAATAYALFQTVFMALVAVGWGKLAVNRASSASAQQPL